MAVLPVVILATVNSAGTGETRMDERGVTDAADQTIFVPRSVGNAHHVPIGDTQSASFAHLLVRLISIEFIEIKLDYCRLYND